MDKQFQWAGHMLPMDASDPNNPIDLRSIEPVRPNNLRIASYPYPHLRDDDGCVLARDCMEMGKLVYILNAVAKAGA